MVFISTVIYFVEIKLRAQVKSDAIKWREDENTPLLAIQEICKKRLVKNLLVLNKIQTL